MNNLNVDAFYFINHNLQNEILNQTIPVLTHFGGFVFIVGALILTAILAKIFNKRGVLKLAILCLVSLFVSDLIAVILKYVVAEPRPFVSLDNVNLLITENDPSSFPSGHATCTFTVVTCLILNSKKFFKKYYLVINIALAIISLLIAFSRVYVGVHYPVDVLAGAIIGIFGAYVVNRLTYNI